MTLAGVVAIALTLQALSASVLLIASREVGRSATSHRALEAEAVWRTAAADGAAPAQAALAVLSPGAMQSFTVPAPAPAWEVVAALTRAPSGGIGALRLTVIRRTADGTPLAARRGALLLRLGAADTGGIGTTDPGAMNRVAQ